MINKKIFYILIGLLFFSGCSSGSQKVESFGHKSAFLIYQTKGEDIKENITTEKEVVEKYDDPVYKWLDKDNYLVYNYQYFQPRHSWLSYIPIGSFFAGKTLSQYYEVTITFKNNVVKEKFLFNKELSCKDMTGNCSR